MDSQIDKQKFYKQPMSKDSKNNSEKIKQQRIKIDQLIEKRFQSLNQMIKRSEKTYSDFNDLQIKKMISENQYKRSLQDAEIKIQNLLNENSQLKGQLQINKNAIEIKNLECIKKNLEQKYVQMKLKIQKMQKENIELKDRTKRCFNKVCLKINDIKSSFIDFQQKIKKNLEEYHAQFQNIMYNIKKTSKKFQIRGNQQNRSKYQIKKNDSQILNRISELFSNILQERIQLSKDCLISQILEIEKKVEYKIITRNFFTSSDIIKQQDETMFLLKATQQLNKLSTKKLSSKLLYKYHDDKKNNFHSLVDHYFNILVVIKLQNGNIIGGYSFYPFKKDQTEKIGKGFVFNLTKRRIYHQKTQNFSSGVITYDQYYLIFGYSEIRIKTSERKVFSNFSSIKKTFDYEKDTFKDFMCQDQSKIGKQIAFQSYEIYTIYEQE